MSTHQDLMTAAYTKWAKDLNYAQFVASLPKLEAEAVVLGNLNYQVENGGFSQWHDNRYHEGAGTLLTALESIGTETAKKVAHLVRAACKAQEPRPRGRGYYVDGPDYDDDDDSGVDAELDGYDNTYYEVQDVFLAEVEAYLNRSEG